MLELQISASTIIGDREENQDIFSYGHRDELGRDTVRRTSRTVLGDDTFFAMVCDGMGSAKDSSQLANDVIRGFGERVRSREMDPMGDVIRPAVENLLAVSDETEAEYLPGQTAPAGIDKWREDLAGLLDLGKYGIGRLRFRVPRKLADSDYGAIISDLDSALQLKYNPEAPDKLEAGSTVSGVAIREKNGKCVATQFNVGDSPVYLIRSGSIEQKAYIDNLAGNRMRSGIPLEYDANGNVIGAETLTRVVGNGASRAPGAEGFAHVSEYELFPGDMIIVASDGLCQLDEQTVKALASENETDTAAILVKHAFVARKGISDNITVICIKIIDDDAGNELNEDANISAEELNGFMADNDGWETIGDSSGDGNASEEKESPGLLKKIFRRS